MSFFKRLSDSFWSYVSPSKSNATRPATTPQTVPRVKRKPGRPPKHKLRRASMEDIAQRSNSMSPVERVDTWRMRSPTSQGSPFAGKKRKAPATPTAGARRRSKFLKMEDDDMYYSSGDGDISTNEAPDGRQYDDPMDEDVDEDMSSDNIRVAASPSIPSHAVDDEHSELDTSLVVSEEEYTRDSPNHKKMISPTQATFDRGVSTEELRAQGWDDDHINLVQRIAMRGFESLMPNHWSFDWPFMPDALFSETPEAFISSVRGDHYRPIKALERLFELGGRVRDRVFMMRKYQGQVQPEEQSRRMLTEYIKWADGDSGLDKKTAIPLLALECKPSSVEGNVLQENAKRSLDKLATRYREAFRVKQSIEDSPASRASTILSHPVPTLYAIVASHTLIALVAYNPAEEEPEVKSVAFFDMKDKNYDVWNALALAIVVCHLRNVQMRIAEETGIGLRAADAVESEESDDPDR